MRKERGGGLPPRGLYRTRAYDLGSFPVWSSTDSFTRDSMDEGKDAATNSIQELFPQNQDNFDSMPKSNSFTKKELDRKINKDKSAGVA